MLHDDFDFKKPDYGKAFKQRMDFLQGMRSDPASVPQIKAYYALNPADFISDFGMTYDPRNADIGLPTAIPFVLFDKQREWVDYILRKWRAREPALVEKSREVGISWLAMSLASTLCLFQEGIAIGVGSYLADYVDIKGSMKALLPKARMFVENLPYEFRGDWVAWRDAPYMRVDFPSTGSNIGGHTGDEIGRGDRTSFFIVDEAAHLKHPELVDAALSQTTNCRIDMSSVRGMGNPFAQKRWGGKIEVFIFDWRDDPRKDQAWYDKQCEVLDPVVVAQEIDRDYSASVTGIVIPGAWVKACIDAKKVLGIAPSGRKGLAYDVADEGEDKHAIVHAEGTEILTSEEWSGKGSDIFAEVEYVFDLCDDLGLREFRYDSDGIGAGVRGDARVLNERRAAAQQISIRAVAYRGSASVVDPEGIVEGTIGRNEDGEGGRTNQDYFGNHKAQAWFAMRNRCKKTFRWVRYVQTEGKEGAICAADEILSISSACPNHMKLVAEMSQATFKTNEVGKVIIQKKGSKSKMKSPNLADAAVIHFAPMETVGFEIDAGILQQVAAAGARPGRRR